MEKQLRENANLVVRFINWLRALLLLLFRQPKVSLEFSLDPYFVGSYAKIKVRTLRIPFDDLDFVITEGAPGGYISPCRDAEFDPANPDIMFCFGYKSGTYHVEVRRKSTDTLLDTFSYKIDALWKDNKIGPSYSFHGISEGYTRGSTWGGGDSTQPQNVNIFPQSGTRKIALVLVDTASQRYTTDADELQAIKDTWLNNIKNGITSSRNYFKEVSYNNFDIDCDIYGPIHLSGSFDTYFENVDGRYDPISTFAETCIEAGQDSINFSKYKSVLFIIQTWRTTDSEGNPLPPKYSWAWAWGNDYTTNNGNVPLRIISMAHDWDVVVGRPIYSTASHELGHNLDLPDQYGKSSYSAITNNRTLKAWDLMAWETLVPHLAMASRLMLGWLDPDNIKLFNFAANGGMPVDELVYLSPIEKTPPQAGCFSGIEVRIADGWNYYIEYRKAQTTQIGDQSLPTDNAVLVTDVISSGYTAPITRPSILKVMNDPDGDGSVLTNGLDYKETDNTTPTYPTDFRISVDGIEAAGTKAAVRIQYGVNSKPDPAITPWPASPERQWQSPDIEVQNERTRADSSWFNVPWAGHQNTIIAKVTNRGTLNAPSVKVDFIVKDFTVGGAPETRLETVVQDINAGETVAFKTEEWNPPQEGHYCIIAKIHLYQLPVAPYTVEMTEFNNVAQSNYDRFISATASPAERIISYVTVGNPYSLPTRIYINPNQTNPYYRTYLEHKSLYLNPGETRKVAIMFEYDPQIINTVPVSLGDQTIDDSNRNQLIESVYKRFHYQPNNARFACFIVNPHSKEHPAIELLGGAEVQVTTGRKTEFERFEAYKERDNTVSGAIITADDNQRVTQGKVIIIMKKVREEKTVEEYETIPVTTSGDFMFSINPDNTGKLLSVQAYYLPAYGYSDCYSKIITY